MTTSLPDLRAAAASVRENTNAPYSNFKVGAAMRAKSGKPLVLLNV